MNLTAAVEREANEQRKLAEALARTAVQRCASCSFFGPTSYVPPRLGCTLDEGPEILLDRCLAYHCAAHGTPALKVRRTL